ncbi:MAG: hypothetical protein HYZ62_01430 [Candidatus Andersenbacteria bacterium]|nr:hypothetical protein [Candidatus Andersenbacteria bacterium]
MLSWIFKKLLALAGIAVILFGVWQYAKRYVAVEQAAPQVTKGVGDTAFKDHKVLIVQVRDDETKKVLECGAICQTLSVPPSIGSDALFDGQSWYYYAALEAPKPSSSTKKNSATTEKVSLVRYWPSTKATKPIATETELIKPRNLYLNPTGTKLVYFLDNIAEPQKHLSEMWQYDTTSQSVSILAENIFKPDIITRPRWNSTGTALWFVANSGTTDKPKVELIVSSPDAGPAKAAFTLINWQQLTQTADTGIMDISQDVKTVAYAKKSLGVFDRLIVTNSEGEQYATTATGTIPYLEWLPDNSLIYATQDALGFTFWRLQDNQATAVASQFGNLISGKSDSSGQFILFVGSDRSGQKLAALSLGSRTVRIEGAIPEFGKYTFIVGIKDRVESSLPEPSNITAELNDDEIAAFIDANLATIAEEKNAKKMRFITTQEPNTIYMDYTPQTGEPKRILLTIHDAVNIEWSIRARYELKNAQWQKVQGGGIESPKPVKLYEWEESLQKWVLKTQFSS